MPVEKLSRDIFAVLYLLPPPSRYIISFPATRVALVAKNSSIALSAASLLTVLLVEADALGRLAYSALIGLSILMASLGFLACIALKICLTKDWLVVICGESRERLASQLSVYRD